MFESPSQLMILEFLIELALALITNTVGVAVISLLVGFGVGLLIGRKTKKCSCSSNG